MHLCRRQFLVQVQVDKPPTNEGDFQGLGEAQQVPLAVPRPLGRRPVVFNLPHRVVGPVDEGVVILLFRASNEPLCKAARVTPWEGVRGDKWPGRYKWPS